MAAARDKSEQQLFAAFIKLIAPTNRRILVCASHAALVNADF